MDMDGFTINVELYSKSSDTTEVVTLQFEELPPDIQGIKDQIEKNFSVPTASQTLYYSGTEISVDSSLSSLYLRSGDSLRVVYQAKGETEEVKSYVKWLMTISGLLSRIKPLSKGEKIKALATCKELTSQHGKFLSRSLFCPYSDLVKYTNCTYFTSLGGVALLIKVHRLAIETRKEGINSFLLAHLEHACCQACSSYSMHKDCASILAQCGGLENNIETFLTTPANSESLIINQHHKVIENALCVILNITELPDYQQRMSLHKEVIRQCFLAGNSYDCVASTAIVGFFLCLSRCLKAHENILQPYIVEGVITICEKSQHNSFLMQNVNLPEAQATKSYSAVMFAQLICGSSHLLQNFSLETLNKMDRLFDEVCAIDPSVIRTFEQSEELYWVGFSDCVSYIYQQCSNLYIREALECSTIVGKLCSHSIDILLHYLQNTLGRAVHVEIIIKEKLLDYIVALPWIVPAPHKERAKCVIKELRKLQPISPLSLSSLAKALLASCGYSLQSLIEMTSISDLSFN